MEKLILILASFVCICYTYAYKKEFLFIFPTVYLLYRCYITFNPDQYSRYLPLVFEGGGLAWITATTYITVQYSLKKYLERKSDQNNSKNKIK